MQKARCLIFVKELSISLISNSIRDWRFTVQQTHNAIAVIPGCQHQDRHRSGSAITLDNVAKIAGVSPITVSRAINTPGIVAPETLIKIKMVIDKTGYAPNLLAGGLASKISRLIAAIVPSIANLVYSSTIRVFNY